MPSCLLLKYPSTPPEVTWTVFPTISTDQAQHKVTTAFHMQSFMSVLLRHPVKCVKVKQFLPTAGGAGVLKHLTQVHTAGQSQVGTWFWDQAQPRPLAPCSVL